MKLSYSEQLKHPNWQRRRLEAMSAAGFECSYCGDKESMLHVHHKRYVKGRMAWEYEPHELAVLCEACHRNEHVVADELRELLLHVDAVEVLALLRGYWADADWFDPSIGDAGTEGDPHAHAIGIVAMLCKGLKPQHLKEVAVAAAKLHGDDSEAMHRLQGWSDKFDQLG